MAEQTVDLSPYAEDGVREHRLSLEMRVPIINTHNPRWNYITAIAVRPYPAKPDLDPTDDEIRVVGSFHEQYCSYWYGPPHTGYRGRAMDKRPFDIDGGANGVVFVKYFHGGWGYRRRSWTRGPSFVPSWPAEPMPLAQVMDRVHREPGAEEDTAISERWAKWKADHPDIFGEQP